MEVEPYSPNVDIDFYHLPIKVCHIFAFKGKNSFPFDHELQTAGLLLLASVSKLAIHFFFNHVTAK